MNNRLVNGIVAASFSFLLTAFGGGEFVTAEAQQTPSYEKVWRERLSDEQLINGLDEALRDAQASKGSGAPAMWRLADNDTTIHLFGTVHLLRPGLEWRTEAIDRAIEEAGTIVFETDTMSPKAQRAIAREFVRRGMFSDGQTLKGVLNDKEEAVVSTAFESVGASLPRMNRFEPWMASVNLGVLKMMSDGHDPNAGVESIIATEAKAAGKSIVYLETLSQQTDAFDLLPEKEQINMLYGTALLLDESPQLFDILVDEWADGDVEGIAKLVANPNGFGSTEATYQSFLVNRNAAWVPQIEAMLGEPGSVFIAVGAGHLAGKDSVIKMLRDRGHKVEGPLSAQAD